MLSSSGSSEDNESSSEETSDQPEYENKPIKKRTPETRNSKMNAQS